MHDNLKTAVLERLPGHAPTFHPRYRDFAAHYGALRQRELHALAHVRRILLLVETYGRETVAHALAEAVELGAYGSDYLRNLLTHRQALAPVIGQLHLTRSAELLELEVPPPVCRKSSTAFD